ncbi:MAG: hypothetical protein HZC24_07485, partial [Rhodocyclales bacterium]|nr:hypothetical protein [Rhodocyclales bacterium]
MRQVLRTLFFAFALGLCGLAAAQGLGDENLATPFGGLLPRLGGGPQLQFNHNATGFPLEGAHVRERCESCHVQGVFRGTPRDCAVCHVAGGRAPGKATTHIPTTRACDTCHRSIVWSPTTFRHLPTQGVAPGGCIECHSGVFRAQNAVGKPLTHPVTSAACDACHKTGAWLPAGYTHALADAGKCATCHNGARATGKAASHIPTTVSCDACHSTGIAWAPISVSISSLHAVMAGPVARGNCAICHSGALVGQNAQIKPPTHVATTQQCDTCHSASVTSWATATLDHDAVTPPVANRCSTCHGVNALGKPTSHVPTGAQCDTCHTNTGAFKPAQMNHVGLAGQCASCHNGAYTFANAQAKAATHIPTTGQCDVCHVAGFVNWSPVAMNHAGTAGRCAACHSGGYVAQNAQSKPTTHVATTAPCDTCHKSTTSWATATFNHAAAATPVAGRCATCHNSAAALGKPVSHIPTGAQCDTCHANFSAFKPAQMNHAGTSGQCATCHNGSYRFANALARPLNHISTPAQCDTCHVAGFVSWSPARMNHAGLAGQCSSCHSGTYVAQNAQIKPITHVATTAQCDTCHTSTTTWATAVYQHPQSATGACATCHNGATALGKPTNHVPTTAQCDTCHSNFSAFKPARMNHAGTGGQCATCHGGGYVFANALAKSPNHIPTIAQCDSCHSGGFTAFTPSTMNHAGLAGQCAACHGGAYVAQNAQAKTPTHIATTAQCDTCHQSTTSWATATFNHATATPAVAGRCATCHNGSSALGKPTNHVPTTAQCDACHTNQTAFAPAAMSHGGTSGPAAAGNCATCHGGAYLFANAQAKTPTHVATTAQCDTCHKSTVTWAGATFSHDANAVGNCATCHNGVAVLGKPTTHIPTTAQCDTCHVGYAAFKPARMNHAASAGQCATCHGGSHTAANALAKPTTHIPTAAQCDACHINGFVSFTPSTMNHGATSAPVAAGNCATCHGGAYVAQNAQAKTPTHIATTAQCDTCHRSMTSWATATYNHATATPAVAGRCATCHNGTNALGKPTTHIPTSAQCDTCHSGFVAFAPAAMNHAATAGPAASRNCATCHGGAYTAVNAQAKPATHIATTQSCDGCHTTSAWKPTSFGHQGVAAGTCATCHNGSAARGKPTAHLPTSAACDACHANFSVFAPATMNHAATSGPAAAGNCATCHSGTYLSINAQIKPATHVATTAQCDACHGSTTSWATASYAHDATAVGRCATCHNGTTALGKPTTHIPTTAQCST